MYRVPFSTSVKESLNVHKCSLYKLAVTVGDVLAKMGGGKRKNSPTIALANTYKLYYVTPLCHVV